MLRKNHCVAKSLKTNENINKKQLKWLENKQNTRKA